MSTGLIDPLDDGAPEPSPGRVPAPRRPEPAAPAAPLGRVHGLLEMAAVAAVSVALAIGGTAWWLGGRRPEPVPAVDAVALGRSFAPKLAASLADGFEACATALEGGKSPAEADAALKAAFDPARKRAFAEHAAATFAAVVPAKSEIKDDETRKRFARLHRDFAKGLRGGK